MSWSLSQPAIRFSSDVTTRLPGSRFEGGRGEREGRSWLEDVSRCSGWERLDWTGPDWTGLDWEAGVRGRGERLANGRPARLRGRSGESALAGRALRHKEAYC